MIGAQFSGLFALLEECLEALIQGLHLRYSSDGSDIVFISLTSTQHCRAYMEYPRYFFSGLKARHS